MWNKATYVSQAWARVVKGGALEKTLHCTGIERTFSTDQIIVSKTDCAGRITYANDVFLDISGYTEAELLGKPHNMIRHPEMPRVVFKLLWDTIQTGNEVFAYVINRCKNGDHYWVFAHATPNFDANHNIVGYHSCRRVPRPGVLEHIRPFYAKLYQAEQQIGRTADAMVKSASMIEELYRSAGYSSYEEFIITFGQE